MRLTPEGLVFRDEAREILSRAERAVEMTKRSSQGVSGKLTVGLCGPVTALFLPRVIRRFRRQFPGVAVALRERAPAEQVEALLSGQIDVGFTRSVPAELRHLVNRKMLFQEPVVVALPKGHPLAAEEAIAVSDPASCRLVLYCRENSPEIFDAVVSMCKRAKFSPKIADTPSSWQSVLTMIEADEGVGLVPECVQHSRANDVVFRPLRGTGIRLDAIMTWRRGEANAMVENFLALLERDSATNR